MFSQYASKCLPRLLRGFVPNKIVSRQPVKCFTDNDRRCLKTAASFCWKTSAFYVAAQCAISDDTVRNKLHLPEPVDLSNLNLIRRAAAVAVDAATQLLTQTLAAAMESSETYRNAMEQMIQLMEDSVEQGNSSYYQEQIWDRMVSVRNQLNTSREALLELESFMAYVMKLANDTAETSYMAGAEFVSTAMCERLNSAEQLWTAEREKIKQVEDIYMRTHKKFVINYTESP